MHHFPRPLAALLLAMGLSVTLGAADRRSASVKPSAAVRHWMKGMTLRDEVAQLVFVAFPGAAPNSRSREYLRLLRLIRDVKVGGLIVNNAANGRTIQHAEPYALAAFLNRLQRIAKVPLLVGGDFERGASMRVAGTTVFPHAMAFGAAGDPEFSRFEGQVTAQEARALGVHWVYAPVADVNVNPDNPVLNIRSFGEDPQAVAAQVAAFIEGAHSDRRKYVLTTAKHFPGHGDTSVDSHLNLATIPASRERLESVELVPFRAAIAAGTDAVMTAHVAVPALGPPDLPATLSPATLTGLLRGELGFKGLVITDALDMGGIVKGFPAGDAAVRAIEAGADTLCGVREHVRVRVRARESDCHHHACGHESGCEHACVYDRDYVSVLPSCLSPNPKWFNSNDDNSFIHVGLQVHVVKPPNSCFIIEKLL